MTRQKLSENVTKRLVHHIPNVQPHQVEKVIEETMKEIMSAMASGEDVFLRTFGTFKLVQRKEKKARIIKSNQQITVPAHTLPTFKPCPDFKEAVRKSHRTVKEVAAIG